MQVRHLEDERPLRSCTFRLNPKSKAHHKDFSACLWYVQADLLLLSSQQSIFQTFWEPVFRKDPSSLWVHFSENLGHFLICSNMGHDLCSIFREALFNWHIWHVPHPHPPNQHRSTKQNTAPTGCKRQVFSSPSPLPGVNSNRMSFSSFFEFLSGWRDTVRYYQHLCYWRTLNHILQGIRNHVYSWGRPIESASEEQSTINFIQPKLSYPTLQVVLGSGAKFTQQLI